MGVQRVPIGGVPRCEMCQGMTTSPALTLEPILHPMTLHFDTCMPCMMHVMHVPCMPPCAGVVKRGYIWGLDGV